MEQDHNQQINPESQNETGEAVEQAPEQKAQAPTEQAGSKQDNQDPRVKAAREEAARYRKEKSSMKQELEALRREKAEQGGDWKSAFEQADKAKAEAEANSRRMAAAFGQRLVRGALEQQASTMGCIDIESVAALVDPRGIDLDEDFHVDGSQVRERLEDLRKRKPFLFQKAGPKIQDVKAGALPPQRKAKSVEEMSDEEYKEFFRKNFS